MLSRFDPSIPRMTVPIRPLLAGGAGGIATGGLLAADALSQYGPISFGDPILAVPLVGVGFGWWTTGLRDRLLGLSLLAVVAGAVVIIAVATPLFVLESPSMPERTLLLANAIARGIVLSMLGTLLTTIGTVVAIGVQRELAPIPVSRSAPWIGIVLSVVVLVCAIGLVATTTHNYGSAVEQRTVTLSLGDHIETHGSVIVFPLEVPNRLRGPLTIESVLLFIERPEQDRISVHAFPDRTVPARSQGTVSVSLSAERLESPLSPLDPTVTVSGFAYTTGFNGYRARLDLPPTTRRLTAL